MTSALRGRSIAIYGLNYWPEETGNAPYTTGFAEHLASLGADVTVCTGLPYYPEWRVDTRYGRRLRCTERRNGVTIRRFRQYVPSTQSAARRVAFEMTFFLNAMLARSVRPVDAYIGILPALADGLLAQFAARRAGVPYGMLVQDLVGQSAAQSGIAGGGRIAGATSRIEAGALRDAARVAVVSDGFIPPLERAGIDRSRIDLVPNWSHVTPPPPFDRAALRDELGWAADEFIVLHSGNMGLKQGLENVVDAARIVADRQLPIRFVLMGNGNQRAMLQARAAGIGAISFKEPAPRDEFMSILAAADLLLVNERDSVTDMSLPSKLTSYYVSGRPIIAAVSPAGVTAREVERSGAGEVVSHGDPAALVDRIMQLRDDPARLAAYAATGPRFAAEHRSPEACLSRATAFVERVLQG